MPELVLPNDIENDTPADAVEVEQNLNVLQNYINNDVIRRDGATAMAAPLLLVGDPLADNHAATKAYVDAILPVGVILPYGGVAAPAGRWAVANGAALATASYPQLFAVIGYRYGGSGGSFNLPNLAARVPIGVDATQTRFDTTGKIGGSFAAVNLAHTHTINHDHAQVTSSGATAGHTHTMAHTHSISHNHAAGTTSSAGAHTHTTSPPVIAQYGTGNLGLQAGGTGQPMNTHGGPIVSGGAHTHTFDVASFSGNSGGSSAGSTGGHSTDHAHIINLPSFSGSSGSSGTANGEQIPPYVIVNYIVRLD